MEFNFRATDDKASKYIPPSASSSSSMGYFAEQALRAGYSCPNLGRVSQLYQNPSNLRDSLLRELEKERIREEMIAEEVERRRRLEMEVRREMLLEREIALRGLGAHDLSAFSGPSSLLLNSRLPTLHHFEARPPEPFPFNCISEPKITEIKPPSAVNKEKIIFLPKPDGNVSGVKRKAVTPPAPSASALVSSKKKPKEDLCCELCQVSATSEQALNEHFRGKKHKSKAARQSALVTGKNFTIGLFPKKAAEPSKLSEITENKTSEQEEKPKEKPVSREKKSTEGDGKQRDDLTSLIKNEEGDPRKKKQKDAMRFTFWCDMCKIGAFSEKVMNNHTKGKKHLSRLLDTLTARVGESQKGKKSEVVDNIDGRGNGEENENQVPGNGEEMENCQDVNDGAGSGADKL